MDALMTERYPISHQNIQERESSKFETHDATLNEPNDETVKSIRNRLSEGRKIQENSEERISEHAIQMTEQ